MGAAPPQGRLVLRPKREPGPVPPVKEEKREKTWWELELELQAAHRDPNDPADAPGEGLLLQQSYNTPQPLGEVE